MLIMVIMKATIRMMLMVMTLIKVISHFNSIPNPINTLANFHPDLVEIDLLDGFT